jgi:hypothetical protein
MDTAKRCREQSDECLRLMNLAQSDTEARILRDLAHSWVRIANQTERYAKFIAVQSAGYFLADGARLFDPAKFGLPSAPMDAGTRTGRNSATEPGFKPVTVDSFRLSGGAAPGAPFSAPAPCRLRARRP